jgi:hypothetical protein
VIYSASHILLLHPSTLHLPKKYYNDKKQNRAERFAEERLLKGIFKSNLSLDNLPPSIDSLVRPPELQRQQQGDADNKPVRNHTRHDTGSVLWLVHLPEHRGSDNTSNTTESNKRGRAKRALPLPTDVVGLIRHDSGDVGIGTDSGKEDAEVARAVVGAEPKDREADEAEAGVDDD